MDHRVPWCCLFVALLLGCWMCSLRVQQRRCERPEHFRGTHWKPRCRGYRYVRLGSAELPPPATEVPPDTEGEEEDDDDSGPPPDPGSLEPPEMEERDPAAEEEEPPSA